jgi:hypothetical protein
MMYEVFRGWQRTLDYGEVWNMLIRDLTLFIRKYEYHSKGNPNSGGELDT